jgi:hypothetical protein
MIHSGVGMQNFNIWICIDFCEQFVQDWDLWNFVQNIIVKFIEFSSLLQRYLQKDPNKIKFAFLWSFYDFVNLNEFLKYLTNKWIWKKKSDE